jgi:hypothetical protein
MHKQFPVCLFLAALFAGSLPAQITGWRFVKGPLYLQLSDNAPAAASGWSIYSVVTALNGSDVAAVSISGGGINGSLNFEEDDPGVFVLEIDYPTQAAMNLQFPSSSAYVLTATGGALGTITQPLVVGPEVYPPTPYLTNGVHTAIQQYDSTSPFAFTWNSPGSNTSSLQIFSRDDDDVFGVSPASVMGATVPANTLIADECYALDVEFQNPVLVSAGEFGVAGDTSHNTLTTTWLGTFTSPTSGPCSLVEEFGSGCDGLTLSSNLPSIGTTWSLITDGISPLGIAFTFFSQADLDPALPLLAAGLSAPGCSFHVDPSLILTSLGGAVVSGQLSIDVALPNSTALWGVELVSQTLGLTTSNAAGVATSNGLYSFVGGR